LFVVWPVFAGDRLIGFTYAYSHHTDIGGRFPGGMSSWATSSFEEGVRIPLLRLFDAGTRNDALVDLITANIRDATTWLGDMAAKVGGCRRGAEQLLRLVEARGYDAYRSCCDYLYEQSASKMQEAVGLLPDGEYSVVEHFEDDGIGTPGTRLAISLTLE